MTTSSGWMSLLAFLFIIAMIPVALWLLKRTPMGGAGANGLMRTVAVLPMNTNQRLITVEVGAGAERRWLVLGVTPQQITTLHTMMPQADAPSQQLPSFGETPFGQMLARFRNKGIDNNKIDNIGGASHAE